MFRTANERAADWSERHDEGRDELYFCECADPECREKIAISRADYEKIRSDSRQFVLATGHEISDVETVVAEGPGWSIVKKEPEVTEIVEALDPRRQN
jgi:hypothetical protein